MELPGLRDRVAVVTGHSGGIGGATAELLARCGAQVEGLSLPEIDLTEDAAVEAAVAGIAARRGGIDVLVHCAGWTTIGGIDDCEPADFDRTLAVNLRAPYMLTRAVLPHMLRAGRGSVIGVASDLAVIAKPYSAAYAASKAGIMALMRSGAIDYAGRGVRFNTVCPGGTETGMLDQVIDLLKARYPERYAALDRAAYAQAAPLGRVGRPGEIAWTIAFLASDAASFITGATIMADGGMSAG